MRKGRFSEEQIIAILREQEAGMATSEVCRRHGISSATFYAWKSVRNYPTRAVAASSGFDLSRLDGEVLDALDALIDED